MLPLVSALSTIAVLPSPWLWVAGVSPAPLTVCLMISPRIYDSVKRLEPTCSVGPAPAAAHAANAMAADRQPMEIFARMNAPRSRRCQRARTAWVHDTLRRNGLCTARRVWPAARQAGID